MNIVLLVLLADGGTTHETWTPWHALAACVIGIALVVWAFRQMGHDLENDSEAPQQPPTDQP